MPLTRRVAASLIAAAWFSATAGAAPAYPDRPIRVIVPFAPGGGGDTLAYGTNGTHGINQALYKSTGFDPVKDFAPISRFTQIALLVVTNPAVPAGSAKELIAYLKANPDKVNVASAGNGTTSHLAQVMFANATGVRYQHVPYRGGGPAKIDLMSGQVQMMIEIMPSVLGLAREGKLHGLAVTTAKRWPLAPDIPALAEDTLPGFEVTAWDGWWAPAGTPKDIIATLNAAARKALADPQLRDALLKSGAEPAATSPEELGAFVTSELPRWGKAVEQSGAKVE